jgi:hypothetical protein
VSANLLGSLGKKLDWPLSVAFSVGDMISSYTAAAGTLGRLSKTLGVSVGELDAWGQAAQQAGGSVESFQSSIQTLNSRIQAVIVSGDEVSAGMFQQLGIDLKDANGNAKSSAQVLRELAAAADMMDPAQFAVLAGEMGLDEGTISLLRSGSAEVDKLVGSMKELSYTELDAKIAIEFDQNLKKLEKSFQKVTSIIVRLVLPIVSFIADKLQIVISKVATILEGLWSGFGEGGEVAEHLAEAWEMLQEVGEFVFEILSWLIEKFFSHFGGVFSAIGRMIKGFVKMIRAIFTGEGFLEGLMEFLGGLAEWFVTAFSGFIFLLVDIVIGFILGAFNTIKKAFNWFIGKKDKASDSESPAFDFESPQLDDIARGAGKAAVDTVVPGAPGVSGNAIASARPRESTTNNIDNSKTDQKINVTVAAQTDDPRRWGQVAGDEINKKLVTTRNTGANQ